MRRLPAYKSYGRYPDDRRFGDFRVSYETDSSELVADGAYINAGATDTKPKDARTLTRVAGVGTSPVVGYEGTGAYFLDKVRDGVWRLELYPDEVLVRDPFEQPQPDKAVSRLLYRNWPMRIALPDLGANFTATPITVPADTGTVARRAEGGAVAVEPGVWLLSASPQVDRATLPARIARVGFSEYHVNDPVEYPDDVLTLAPAEFIAGRPVEIRARVANTKLADSAKLWLRPAGARGFRDAIAMVRESGNDYVAAAGTLTPGLYEYMVSTTTGERSTTFPGAEPRLPNAWPFRTDSVWTFRVTPADAPLRLLDPKTDYARLDFVRPHESVRNGMFGIVPGGNPGESALSLGVPDLGKDTPERYAASLYIGDTIAARGDSKATVLHVRLRSTGGGRDLDLVLIEKDGAAWHAALHAKPGWTDVTVSLASLKIGRSILIPTPFPGLWNYWREIPQGRGGAGDHIHAADIERLELIVSRDAGKGVEIESVWLSVSNGRRS
jgi:hypothetical protein